MSSKQWYIDVAKNHKLKIFSDYQSLDPYGTNRVRIPPGVSESIEIDHFNNGSEVLYHTHVVSDASNGEDIELNLEDRIVGLVFDASGSMTWNDQNKYRYELAKRFIRRIASTYPGNLYFSIFEYGGTPINVLFAATTSVNNPFNVKNVEDDYPFFNETFADNQRDFQGIRVLRNKDHFPTTPVDGEIVFDGISEKISDTGLEEGQRYYYTIFTFDNRGRFSEGVDLTIVQRTDTIPKGISSFASDVLKGSNINIDDNTVCAWHFASGTGNYIYDFSGNSITDLIISDTVPDWLNQYDVMNSFSGLRFNRGNPVTNSTTASTLLTTRGAYTNNFTIMGWVKPFYISADQPIIARRTETNTDWYLDLQGGTGRLRFSAGGGAPATSTIGLAANSWNHFAVRINSSGSGVFYVNGQQAGTFSADIGSAVSNAYIDVGYKRNVATAYFFGEMCELSIHNVARSSTYITDEYSASRTDPDNGDRLVVLNFDVPGNYDYIGGKARIIHNNLNMPYNENDGNLVYNESVSEGEYYTTYRENFIPGSTQYFRIFSQNSLGNYSHIDDSTLLTVSIPSLSNESLKDLVFDLSSIDAPVVTTATAGNRSAYFEWTPITETYANAAGIYIYMSESGFPVCDTLCSTGTLVFQGNTDSTTFVHRNLLNQQKYYYSFIIIDNFGRTSKVYNVAVTPSAEKISNNLPLMDVTGISYELTSATSVNLWWNDIFSSRIIRGYLDDHIVLYAQITDEFGNSVSEEDITVTAEVVADSYELVDEAAVDIFNDETSQVSPNTSDLYDIAIEYDSDTGFMKGVIVPAINTSLYKNISKLTLTLRLKITIPDPQDSSNNLFEYFSSAITVEFRNPFDVVVINRDNKKVQVFCPNEIYPSEFPTGPTQVEYDGTYAGASEYYGIRTYLTYKGIPVRIKPSFDFECRIANGTICDGSSSLTDSGTETDIADVEPSDSELVVTTEEKLNEEGYPTGLSVQVAYMDINLNPPASEEAVLFYSKYSYNNFEIVKKTTVLFRSPVFMILNGRVPFADALDKAEQYVSIYRVDPDYPEDETRRTYPTNGTSVKWSLTPLLSTVNNRALSTTSSSFPSPESGNSVYSTVDNGLSKHIFIGPVQNVSIESSSTDGGYIYERHMLTSTILWDGEESNTSQILRFLPITSSGDPQGESGSFFLMEFENYKEGIFADGRGYKKALISHNANDSTTKYSDCFRECIANLKKEVVVLYGGQNVYITASDPDVEIIWGDVIEYIDPYYGDWVLDTSNANVSTGTAFVQLSNNDSTYVYFRINKLFPDQKILEFETPQNECECLGLTSIQKFNDEIVIYGAITSIFDVGTSNGIAAHLRGGGNIDNGIPPTILVPKEPLQIRAVGKKASGNVVDSLVIDGVTNNEIILDVSFADHVVTDGTELTLSVVNNLEDVIQVQNSTITTIQDLDTDFSDVVRSYASIVVLPIVPNKSIDANIYVSCSYTLEGVTRTNSMCINIDIDPEDASTTNSLFSDNCAIYNIAAATWSNITSMPSSAGYHCVESNTVTNKIYSIGGVNSSRILDATHEYTVATNSWTTVSPMVTPRMMAMSVIDGNDIYVLGGLEYDSNANKLVVSQSVEKYDSVADSWSILEDMPNVDTGVVDAIEYGVACGIAQIISGKIYILSGIKKISDDGRIVDYNDRILSYDIAGNTWSYSDVVSVTDVDNYYRAFPCSFVDGNNITIFSGSYSYNNVTTFLTDAFTYNVDTEILTESEDLFYSLPNFKERAACATSGTTHYVVGGTNNISSNLRDLENVDKAGAIYNCNVLADMDIGRNGCGVAILGGNLYVIGGVTSGKSDTFLQIDNEIYEGELDLNGINHLDCKITLTDDNGNKPGVDINVRVKGYLQYASTATSLDHIIEDKLTKYVVLFDDIDVTTVRGEGFVSLLPRSDDYLDFLMSLVQIVHDQEALRYKIVIQISVVDDTFSGSTLLATVRSIDGLTIDTGLLCVSTSSNMLIDSLSKTTDLGFNPITQPLLQNVSVAVNGKATDAWITEIENLTSDGVVSAAEAIDIVDDLELAIPIGGSPLYDALKDISTFLSIDTDYDSREKVIYTFIDDEPNCSKISLDDAADYVVSINSSMFNPLVNCNFSMAVSINIPVGSVFFPDKHFPYNWFPYNWYSDSSAIHTYERFVLSIMKDKTAAYTLNRLATLTNGQSISIVSENVSDDIIYILSGNARGSMGYGNAKYDIDLGQEVNIKNITVNYRLYTNTNGRWQIAVSDGGYHYTEYTDHFRPSYTATFTNVIARYIRFNMDLYSGLSISNEEPYDDIPAPGVPAVTDILIEYVPTKVDYIYVNTTEVDTQLDQIAIATNSNITYWDSRILKVGVATSDAGSWSDYESNAKPAREDDGKIIEPFRTGLANEIRMEPLTSIDSYLFEAPNGKWNPQSVVSITRNLNGVFSTISSSLYDLVPREGLVIFNQRQITGIYYINIVNPSKFRVGLKVENNTDTETSYIEGVSYMYATRDES